MFKRLKEIVASPYLAPVTQPAKNLVHWTYRPIRNFCEGVKYGFQSTDDSAFYMRVFRTLNDDYNFKAHDGTMAITWCGMIGGALLAAAGAGVGAYALGFGVPGIGLAAIGATSIGMLAGPFVLAGAVSAVAFVGACALTIIPGVLQGVTMAYKHRKGLVAQAAATQAVPQLASAAPDMKEKAAEMLRSIRKMPPEAQAPLLKALNAQYFGGGAFDAEGIVKAVEAMPETERQSIAKSLKSVLKDSFEAVARDESNAAMALHSTMKTAGPLKLKGPSQKA